VSRAGGLLRLHGDAQNLTGNVLAAAAAAAAGWLTD